MLKEWELGPKRNVLGGNAGEPGRRLGIGAVWTIHLYWAKKEPSCWSERTDVKLKNPYVRGGLNNVDIVLDIQPSRQDE